MLHIVEKIISSSSTWTCPASVTSVEVFMMGGCGGGTGGGGGGGSTASSGEGGGGGAGGTPGSLGTNSTFTAEVVPGTSYSISSSMRCLS